MKHCIFCEAPLNGDNRSKEHVFPQWLLDFLNIRGESIEPTHYSIDGKTLSTRKHTLEGLLAGQVCVTCNGGWMSELEQESMPILKPLITGKTVVVELNDKERQILGRWTAKTAYALNSSSNYLKNIPKEHYNYIRLNPNLLPDKVITLGQQHYGTSLFFWMQSATWTLHGDLHDAHHIALELENKSYKIALQFGKLMLLIAFIPNEKTFPVLWKGIHIPLIPKTGKCGYYEKEEFPWSKSDRALIEFSLGLHVAILK